MEEWYSLLDDLDNPILLFNLEGNLVFSNQATTSVIAGNPDNWHWPEIQNQLPEGYVNRIHTKDDLRMPLVILECIPHYSTVLEAENNRLKKQIEELKRIIDASSDEIFVIDSEGRVTFVSHKIERLYGLTPDEIIGKTVYELEQEGLFYPAITPLVLREKKRQTIIQTTIIGTRLATTANPVFDDKGRLLYIISTAWDLKEMQRMFGHNNDNKPEPALSDKEDKNVAAAETPIVKNHRMTEVLSYAARIARTDATILLLGETGVGKNRMARFIHDSSVRRSGPFVEVNCAAIPESLMESELFGYVRGAFTGSNREGKQGKVAAAHGGTLFLNEVGELPLHLQAKLLDFIQDHRFTPVGGVSPVTVDLRIISATNRDLKNMVQSKDFRADLYYRISVIPIEIPPLRQRPEDIIAISRYILENIAQKYDLPQRSLREDSISALLKYPWPGNVRELENVLERIFLASSEIFLMPEQIDDVLAGSASLMSTNNNSDNGIAVKSKTSRMGENMTLPQQLENFERELVQAALERCSTTYELAAYLGVSQPTIVRKLKKFGFPACRDCSEKGQSPQGSPTGFI